MSPRHASTSGTISKECFATGTFPPTDNSPVPSDGQVFVEAVLFGDDVRGITMSCGVGIFAIRVHLPTGSRLVGQEARVPRTHFPIDGPGERIEEIDLGMPNHYDPQIQYIRVSLP